jgi:hypothetical protein
VVDQRYRADCSAVQRPADPIPDHCYEVAMPPVSYRLRLSENGGRVEIVGVVTDGVSVRGAIGQGPADERVFDLELFAGGRLRLRGSASNWSAELTVFGSGVPIVKSERGHLTAR